MHTQNPANPLDTTYRDRDAHTVVGVNEVTKNLICEHLRDEKEPQAGLLGSDVKLLRLA